MIFGNFTLAISKLVQINNLLMKNRTNPFCLSQFVTGKRNDNATIIFHHVLFFGNFCNIRKKIKRSLVSRIYKISGNIYKNNPTTFFETLPYFLTV